MRPRTSIYTANPSPVPASTMQLAARDRPPSSMGPSRKPSGPTFGGVLGQSEFVTAELEFSGRNQTGKYAVMSPKFEEGTLRTLMYSQWHLKSPALIISIYGGEYEKKRKMKMILKKGLWKGAESTGCWIITDGVNKGISKLAGEAVKDYIDAYGGNRMMAFAVNQLQAISRNDIITASISTRVPLVKYEVEDINEDDDEPETIDKSLPINEEKSLDPNHKFFFFAHHMGSSKSPAKTQSTQTKSSKMPSLQVQEYLNYRSMIEGIIAKWKSSDGDEAEITVVPTCGILVGGDASILSQVHASVVQNRCPFVITKGTSGAADVLALSMILASQPTEDEEEDSLDHKIRALLEDHFPDYPKLDQVLKEVKTLVTEYTYLLSTFDMDEDWDLDGYMISALLSSASTDVRANSINLEQLQITLTLNRADIARDKIFLENKKWKKGELNQFMYDALMKDRCDFVKLFLDQGFNLEQFLSVFMLEKLYTDSIKKQGSKKSLFQQMWEAGRSHRLTNKQVTLKEVGKIIKLLVGDFYHPLYLSKEFQARISEANGYENPAMAHKQVNKGKAAAEWTVPKSATAVQNGHRSGAQSSTISSQSLSRGLVRRKSSLDFLENIKTPSSLSPKSPKVVAIASKEETILKSVVLERPARELMIWSLLIGKLDLAELFWTMEKEPIAAGLLATMLLTSLAEKTDDFTDKEECENFAKRFEEQAEGVLNECYREDESRGQLLINRKLLFYGGSSVILLAAEGRSIRFMAHPCCQDFLSNSWMGKLSPKNSLPRMLCAILLGLTCPIFIPSLVRYSPNFFKGQSAGFLEEATSDEADASAESSTNAERKGTSEHFTLKLRFEGVIEFYMSPIVRFVYNTISYICLLCLFSYMLLVDFYIEFDAVESIICAWIITLLFEEVKQASMTGISFSTYMSDDWNKLDCLAVGLFILGFILRLVALSNPTTDNSIENLEMIQNELFGAARVMYAFSLVSFYVRLMYIFSFHVALGPKLIMIGKMIRNDLIPFLAILMIFLFGYGVAAHAIQYPSGYFSPGDLANVSSVTRKSSQSIFLDFLTVAWYQMFGEFGLDAIAGKDCGEECPHYISIWLVPFMLSFYVLITQILLFNLLIAMFTKTYDEVESSSIHYWNYQRYQMITDYLNRSPIAPPFIIIWQIYETGVYFYHKIKKLEMKKKNSIFCQSFKSRQKKEQELMKWEHMKAMDFLRNMHESNYRSQRGGVSMLTVTRGGMGAGAGGQQAVVPGESNENTIQEIHNLQEYLTLEFEKRFRDVDNQFQHFVEIDDRIKNLTGSLEVMQNVIQSIIKSQGVIIKRIEELPHCQCTEMVEDTAPPTTERVHPSPGQKVQSKKMKSKLELAVKSAIEEAKDSLVAVLTPPAPPPPPPPPPPVREPTPPPPKRLSFNDLSPEDDVGDPDVDIILRPSGNEFRQGRIAERRIQKHKLWKLEPFNFEIYPGMRMNVPPEKSNWTVSYPNYFAYDNSEESLVPLSGDSKDPEELDFSTVTFNAFDAVHNYHRGSLMGEYGLSPETKQPLNPKGRSGLRNRGFLLRWGPNHCYVFAFTRWMREKGKIVVRNGKPILQCVALYRKKQWCLPWFFTDHKESCKFEQCCFDVSQSYVKKACLARFSARKTDLLMEIYEAARKKVIFKGYLDDHLNADSAWVEAVVLNIHENDQFIMRDEFVQLFIDPDCDVEASWLEVSSNPTMRSSHNEIIKILVEEHTSSL